MLLLCLALWRLKDACKDGRRRRVPRGGIHNLSDGFIVTLRRVNHPADSMRLDPARQSSSSCLLPLFSHISLHMDANPFVTFFFFIFFYEGWNKQKREEEEGEEGERAKQYYIRHGIAMLCVCTRVTWSFPPNKSTNSPVNPWAWSMSFFFVLFFCPIF